MNLDQSNPELETLHLRARAGDPHAVRELESRMSPALRRIVRRVLRLNRADTPLERGILGAAARHAALAPDSTPVSGNALVSSLAQRLWEGIIGPEAPVRSAASAISRWEAETDSV